ncbi:MAG: hypothetical protein ACK5JD_11775, partial [Mangrovibacterium sp.]
FEEQVRFRLNTAKKVSFPLYLRIPGWCKQASVELNGKKLDLNAPAGTFVKLDREWNNNDALVLNLPMEMTCTTWQVNQNSVSVSYGPLTFSLKIDEEYQKISSTASAISDSKWQKNADPEKWPAYQIEAKSAWNYGLLIDEQKPASAFELLRKPWPADDYPFTAKSVPIEIRTRGKKIPSWCIDRFGLVDVLPSYPAQTNEKAEDLTLIPMGAARLRISAFPLVQ